MFTINFRKPNLTKKLILFCHRFKECSGMFKTLFEIKQKNRDCAGIDSYYIKKF